MKTKEFYLNNEAAWCPDVTAGTGTIASAGAFVTGTGTAFLSEIKPGYFIVDGGLMYEVAEVVSDTKIRLKFHENADIAALTSLEFIKERIKTISITVGSVAITVNGITYEANQTRNHVHVDLSSLAPVYIDATGSTASVTITYNG